MRLTGIDIECTNGQSYFHQGRFIDQYHLNYKDGIIRIEQNNGHLVEYNFNNIVRISIIRED